MGAKVNSFDGDILLLVSTSYLSYLTPPRLLRSRTPLFKKERGTANSPPVKVIHLKRINFSKA
jgi:hypothetical protein